MKVQRLRLRFGRGEAMKYVTHLDMMRFWERALRRAGVPVAYSEGFSPHAQIALASPLPVGVTSDAELLDVFLEEPRRPQDVVDALRPQLPEGAYVYDAEEVAMLLPSLQAEVRAAEYEVDVPTLCDAREAVARFLALETLAWEHKREEDVRTYDLRGLVTGIEVEPHPPAGIVRLRMTLRNDSNGAGRPEQVVAALGLPAPVRVHRTLLRLAGISPVRQAWRKRGRFAD